ncbi:MAG: aspartate aminotransferase family protein [Anaerolineae bacterium]
MGEGMWSEIENRHTSGCYPKRPLTLVRGEGVWVWDDAGRRYLDCTSGQGVALIGHAHPAVAAAVAQQAATLITCPEIFYNDRRAALLARLTGLAPAGLTRAFLCNSGTEAVEAALKFARLLTGRPGIIAMQRGFHGRTFGSLSATWEPKYREPFEPLLPGFKHVPYDNLDALAASLDDQTAAVIVEPVQGEGGARPPSPGYLANVQTLCQHVGALLIVDEVQTGFGRTGRWFGCQHDGVTPDLMALGKGMAGGVPMAAVLLHERFGPLPAGSHGSTFGGNPLACAAALATLDVLEQGDLPGQAAVQGAYLLEQLRDRVAPLPVVRQVRGHGLLIGIELRTRVTPYLQSLQALGVLALPAGPTVLRLLPPLVMTPAELDQAVDAVAAALGGD